MSHGALDARPQCNYRALHSFMLRHHLFLIGRCYQWERENTWGAVGGGNVPLYKGSASILIANSLLQSEWWPLVKKHSSDKPGIGEPIELKCLNLARATLGQLKHDSGNNDTGCFVAIFQLRTVIHQLLDLKIKGDIYVCHLEYITLHWTHSKAQSQ